MWLPNIHSLYTPDSDYIIFDIDLEGADAQVVAWDSGAERMKQSFREDLDNHLMNAKDLFNLPFTIDDLRDPKEAKALKKRYESERYQAKRGGHGTNYLASAATVASALGISVQAAERFQALYFELNPEIPAWHDSIEMALQEKQMVTNVFGYHNDYFDRIKNVMSNAVAWIPQSTVANITNYIWDNIETNLALDWNIEMLFQVHDSVVGQFHRDHFPEIIPYIEEQTKIVMPYDDPHIIPTSIEVSHIDWGAVKSIPWEIENAT